MHLQATKTQLSTTIASQLDTIHVGIDKIDASNRALGTVQAAFQVQPRQQVAVQWQQHCRAQGGGKKLSHAKRSMIATHRKGHAIRTHHFLRQLCFPCRSQTIDELCEECAALIEHHEKIQLLSMVHGNLRKTLVDVENIAGAAAGGVRSRGPAAGQLPPAGGAAHGRSRKHTICHKYAVTCSNMHLPHANLDCLLA